MHVHMMCTCDPKAQQNFEEHSVSGGVARYRGNVSKFRQCAACHPSHAMPACCVFAWTQVVVKCVRISVDVGDDDRTDIVVIIIMNNFSCNCSLLELVSRKN